jgi:hypothetical protein
MGGGFLLPATTAPWVETSSIDRVLSRIAHEVVARDPESDPRGAAVALCVILKRDPPLGELDISMHRDDLLCSQELLCRDACLLIDAAQASKQVGRCAVKKVPSLRGKMPVNLFAEPSTRTRTSCRIGRQAVLVQHHQHYSHLLPPRQGRAANSNALLVPATVGMASSTSPICTGIPTTQSNPNSAADTRGFYRIRLVPQIECVFLSPVPSQRSATSWGSYWRPFTRRIHRRVGCEEVPARNFEGSSRLSATWHYGQVQFGACCTR